MNRFLDFEEDIEKIENKINDLDKNNTNFNDDKNKLLEKKKNLFKKIYSNLTA